MPNKEHPVGTTCENPKVRPREEKFAGSNRSPSSSLRGPSEHSQLVLTSMMLLPAVCQTSLQFVIKQFLSHSIEYGERGG
ncbi:hypothetical protein LOAG_04792 [Loa loa]|uniref:Uncharacterized protein n=1 Tax=Loa loa TaxID=7209 RepID=A0A1S0U1F5_LOALO|nr:hypothetical protein LOAG_04792 [Loa loa]EFO23697.2 hypothetical protein LOAG_04792 [Loa loa]